MHSGFGNVLNFYFSLRFDHIIPNTVRLGLHLRDVLNSPQSQDQNPTFGFRIFDQIGLEKGQKTSRSL